jgi:cytochrome c nitrite reductase small subunit
MNDQYDGWLHGSHQRVATCNDCHVPHDFAGKMISKGVHGWNHSVAFTLQNFHEPIQIKPADLVIVENNCVRCHQTAVHDMALLSSDDRPSDGRMVDASCVRCHQGVGHGYRR